MRVYDTENNFLMMLDICMDVRFTETLNKGTKDLRFKVPTLEPYLNVLVEENYIETSDYRFVIKEIHLEGDFFEVYCIADYEELRVLFRTFDCFEKSVPAAYNYCLSNTSWNLSYHSNNNTQLTYQEAMVSGLDMIRKIATDLSQEYWIDSKNKIVHIYDQMGELSTYYSNELRMKQLKKQSDTYEYATVMYPIGKDGLTIKDVNGGKDYITNYSYSHKFIEKYWVDEDYEYPEDLKKAAEAYLEELAQPKASYRLSLSSLGDVHLGDTIILVDKLKKIKQKQRVVRIERFPHEPERSTVDISNMREDFSTTYLKDKEVMKADVAYIKKQLKLMQKN